MLSGLITSGHFVTTKSTTMNAKEEFLVHIKDRIVKCAWITFGDNDWRDEEDQSSPIELKVNFTQLDFQHFLNSINQEYHAGFGGQELFGTIWYTDGTWSERGEYDGSEWWEHHICPKIPERLN